VPASFPTSPFTADFREEFEAETYSLLRRRFVWFSGLLTIISFTLLLLSLTAGLAALYLKPELSGAMGRLAGRLTEPRNPITWAVMLCATAAYSTCFLLAKRGSFGRQGMLRLTYLLVVVDGLLHVAARWADAPGALGLFGVMITHVLACSILPWTPSQAIKPLVPVLIADGVLTVTLGHHGLAASVVMLAVSVLVGMPGTFLCMLRHSRRLERYKLRFFQLRYGQVRRELVDARRIHESLFPPPLEKGPILFSYVYQPMHQIGGDYLYYCRSGSGAGEPPLNIVLMDVTGHGIPAALTVNRLHGELQRIFAEHPDIGPGDVLNLLNRYVHLTLANHSVYVTALCLRFCVMESTLEYASGGHPPAYLRGVDGTLHELAATAIVLGACEDAEFDPAPASMRFGPGDVLIAYTDGALEARNSVGRMIGLEGMRRLVALNNSAKPGEWPMTILQAVDRHRMGPPHDDTLVIEVLRPMGEGLRPVMQRPAAVVRI
jgi:sigma-B regulation protein RsbU (phosphoserine phosphatase)